MKFNIFIIMFFSFGYLNLNATELNIPESYEILDSVSGDLDNDLISELVIVYNNKVGYVDGENIPRELWIYKKNKDKWELWKKSLSAIYGSLDGGMMGDPFVYIEIDNGLLYTSHYGGSSWKWGHDDVFKFHDDDIYLIEYKSIAGKICEHWEEVIFNLISGKVEVNKEYYNCEDYIDEEVVKNENEIFNVEGLKITLENRNIEEIKYQSPKYSHEIYISIKYEPW